MIECNVNNISKSFGADLIFENISFDIKTNERIGLIGPNGCGKTTVMRIIMGDEYASVGNITFRKGSKVGYLDQIPVFDDKIKVIDILNNAFENVFLMKDLIDKCLLSFNNLTGEKLEKAMDKYSGLIHDYELLDGYNVETNINKVCTGLKINDYLQQMTFNLLSGGEKTRVMLGKILLEQPSILMLDEPSNHLDLESIEWLESYLREYKGAVLIISHDRYFLDNVCKKLIELSADKAHVFHGNYSYYVIEKERRFLLEMKVYLAQEKKIKRMENQIQKYRIWGRMRDSDKMFKRAKELEKRLEKISKLKKPKYENTKIKFGNNDGSRSGKRVLEAIGINKSFGDLEVLKNADIEMIFKDRLAILGSNGSGKSTLIKLLLDDANLKYPTYKWGSKLNIGYLAQDVQFDNDSLTVLDYFMNEHIISQGQARSELAKALFIRDDVLKLIKNLSGGEKSKLKLCSLTYNQVNFMVLDEPTNHLDIDSREILEDLLLEFHGTILFVSHDRYFIKKIANRVGEINNKNISYFEGDYEYYKYIKGKIKEEVIVKKKVKPIKVKNVVVNYDSLYKEIEILEEKIAIIDQEMVEYAFDASKLNVLYLSKSEIENKLEILYSKIDD
ncbi:MAG: ABC-F family ATP-binding cassette domain-containing protein [Candidatus Izemoplasma sp.]